MSEEAHTPGGAPWVAQVRAAQAGDRDAFRELYTRFAPMVHAVALGSVDSHAADDVTQDVFLGAWRSLADLREPGRFGGWLASMSKRRALRVATHSTRQRERTSGSASEVEATAGAAPLVATPTSAPTDTDSPTTEEILAQLAALPDALRLPLTLRLVEGLSGPEIATLLDRPPGSVRVNLHRGMQQLRERLGVATPAGRAASTRASARANSTTPTGVTEPPGPHRSQP